jgi:mannosyltransferase
MSSSHPETRLPAEAQFGRALVRGRDRLADRFPTTLTRPVVIGVPMVLSAVLCLFAISGRSLGFDEAATVTIASQHGAALGAAIAHDGGNMSGYYLLLHVLINWFGNSELVLRLPSAIAGVITVGAIAAIADRLFGRLAALYAGILCAVSLPLVFWAQNARGYALMVALVSIAYLAFLSLVDPPPGPERTGRHPDRRLWVVYVLSMTLATYASFVAVLVIAAQVVALLPRRRRRRLLPFSAAVAAYAVLCTPLLVLALQRGSGQLFWVPAPTYEVERQVIESLTSAGQQPSFHDTPLSMLLAIVTMVALIAISLQLWRAARRGDRVWARGATLAWLAVPSLLSFGYSLVAQPFFLPRNLLMSVPAVALLLGAALASPRVPRRTGVALFLLLVVLRGAQVVPAYAVSPEPWQQAAAEVLQRTRPGDCIAFYPLDARMAFQYFFSRMSTPGFGAPREILPIAPWTSTQIFVERYYTLSEDQIARRAQGCRRLWFISSHEGQRNGPAKSRDHRARFLSLRGRLEDAFGHARIDQLGYAAAIHIQLLPGPVR